MVKGVHKKIIEVNHPSSDYFEKAVFYLKPGVTQIPAQLAEAAAYTLLQDMEEIPQSRRPIWKKVVLSSAFGCVAIAIVACAIFLR